MANSAPEMHTYWLIQNAIYNCNHVRRVTWLRKWVTDKRLIIASCQAKSENGARRKFKLMGHNNGCLGELI